MGSCVGLLYWAVMQIRKRRNIREKGIKSKQQGDIGRNWLKNIKGMYVDKEGIHNNWQTPSLPKSLTISGKTFDTDLES